MFTARLLRESTKVTLLHATRLCDVLRAKCKEDTHDSTAQASSSDAPKGKKSCVVDMQEYFFRLTMDVFTVIAFGVDLESVPRPGAPHPFAVAFDTVQAAANRRFNNPFFKLARFLQLTREERAITQGVKVLDAFAKDVIAAKRRTLSTTSAAPPKVAADSTAEVQESRLGPDLLSRFLEDAANKEKREAEEGVAAEVSIKKTRVIIYLKAHDLIFLSCKALCTKGCGGGHFHPSTSLICSGLWCYFRRARVVVIRICVTSC